MEFKEQIANEEFYRKLKKYSVGIVHNTVKYMDKDTQDEIFHNTLEKLLKEKHKIDSIIPYFSQRFKWTLLDYLRKSKEIYSENMNKFDIADEIYTESIYSINLDLLNKQEKLLIQERYYNNLKPGKIQEKYNLKEHVYRRIMERAKYKLKTGKKMGVKRSIEYRGIARLINNQIDKLYPDIESVTKDGYNRTSISKCVNGKLKTYFHKGYEWKFITDIKKYDKEKT